MLRPPWDPWIDPRPERAAQRAALLKIESVCTEGNLEQFAELFASGKWNQPQVEHFLFLATLRGHAPLVRFLLEKGTRVNGIPAVMFNEQMGGIKSIAVLEAYIESGWDVNKPDSDRQVVLPYAAADENFLRWFLDHGADPNLGYRPGAMTRFQMPQSSVGPNRSAQEEAAWIDQLTAELIQNTPDSEKNRIRQNIISKTPAELLHPNRESIDLVALFFRNKAAARARQERGPVPLPPVRKLEVKARPPFAGAGDALNAVASQGTISALYLLIERGAKLENCLGLHCAALQSLPGEQDVERIPMLDHLLALGLDINGSDIVEGFYSMGTPLHCTVRSLQIHKARFLLENGADPERKNQWGRTPLQTLHGEKDINREFTELFDKYTSGIRSEGNEEMSKSLGNLVVSD